MNFWDSFVIATNEMFVPQIKELIRNVPYIDLGDDRQVLDIIVPLRAPAGQRLSPILIYFHGGGWIGGDKASVERMLRRFASEGFLVFNVNYRLAPENPFPAQFQDMALAIRWILERAIEFNGNNAGVILGGDSAGAMLTSRYAAAIHKKGFFEPLGIDNHLHRSHLRGLILFYGLYNIETIIDTGFPMADVFTQAFLGDDHREFCKNARLVSPVFHLNEKFPPVFISSGELDLLNSQSVEFAGELGKKNIECETVFFDKGHGLLAGHAFMNTPYLPCSSHALEKAVQFARKVTDGWHVKG